jgi:hypothetical protein
MTAEIEVKRKVQDGINAMNKILKMGMTRKKAKEHLMCQ